MWLDVVEIEHRHQPGHLKNPTYDAVVRDARQTSRTPVCWASACADMSTVRSGPEAKKVTSVRSTVRRAGRPAKPSSICDWGTAAVSMSRSPSSATTTAVDPCPERAASCGTGTFEDPASVAIDSSLSSVVDKTGN